MNNDININKLLTYINKYDLLEGICFYAVDRLPKKRWLEAEHLFIDNTKCIYSYSVDVIKGRWFEAEKYLTNDLWSFKYRYKFGHH
jgi:hypothetical protein